MTRRRLALLPASAAFAQNVPLVPKRANTAAKVALFSKHLQWLDIPSAAKFAKDAGFDALDLTVRKGGHIEPEKAPVELPKAADAIRKEGLELAMVTTAIGGASEPQTEPILRGMKAAGVKFYRWGGWKLNLTVSMERQVNEYGAIAQQLSALNQKYGVCGVYHTHSGIGEFGADVWDIWLALRTSNPNHLGINFDIGHATVEGGFGGWLHRTKVAGAYLRGVAVKDFLWARNAKGEWRPQWCPIGEGMADLKKFFSVIRPAVFDGPIQLHFEYPMGGAEHGDSKITWTPQQVASAMQRDLVKLRELMRG
jgi:sugar phosphate isomerase/epimerase